MSIILFAHLRQRILCGSDRPVGYWCSFTGKYRRYSGLAQSMSPKQNYRTGEILMMIQWQASWIPQLGVVDESSVDPPDQWDANSISVASFAGSLIALRRYILNGFASSVKFQQPLTGKHSQFFNRAPSSCLVRVATTNSEFSTTLQNHRESIYDHNQGVQQTNRFPLTVWTVCQDPIQFSSTRASDWFKQFNL